MALSNYHTEAQDHAAELQCEDDLSRLLFIVPVNNLILPAFDPYSLRVTHNMSSKIVEAILAVFHKPSESGPETAISVQGPRVCHSRIFFLVTRALDFKPPALEELLTSSIAW